MFKNLLDYNSQENQWIRNHETPLYALAAGVFTLAVVGITSTCVHEVVRKRDKKTK